MHTLSPGAAVSAVSVCVLCVCVQNSGVSLPLFRQRGKFFRYRRAFREALEHCVDGIMAAMKAGEEPRVEDGEEEEKARNRVSGESDRHTSVNNQPDEIHYVNPFVHKLVWDDPIDKAKTALLTVILLPFRVVLILVCLVVAWALANIGLYGLSKEDLRTKPLAGWRRQLRQLTALVMRTLFLFGSFNYIRYKGVRASPKEAPVICVAPHTAFYDSVCVVLFGPSAVVAKYETASLPFFGSRRLKRPLGEFATLAYTCAGLGITIRGQQASRTEAPVLVVSPHSSFLDAVIIYVTGLSSPLVRNADRNLGKLIDYAQPIYVCREDPHSRQTTIREIIQRANSKEDWPQILIFPEGTCTNRTSLIKFKPGAFYPGVPIQPVLMRYPNKVDTVTWTWEGPNAIQLLWRTLTQFHTFCEIEFLPVYYPSEAEKANPKLYADNVRMLMAKALEIPISDYTFDDCKLMTFVKNVNMPHAAAIADIEKLRETLKLDVCNRECEIVNRQREFNDANSLLTFDQFADRLQIDRKEEASHNLFSKFVDTAAGRQYDVIDFREYLLLALFLITLYKPKLTFVESLFQLYGVDGRVNRDQLYDTLKHLVRITRKDVNAIFLLADPNNVGTVDFKQFLTAIEHHPLQQKLQKNNDPNNLRLG
uniref:EF-hand domain-containing protein n=1 Tax=Anopheles farauti TaxID=69004 RepID=A0A182QJ75_9DIPT